jgi:hypothetical protein
MIDNQVRKIIVNNKEIVVVDFSNLKEDQMIELISISRANSGAAKKECDGIV